MSSESTSRSIFRNLLVICAGALLCVGVFGWAAPAAAEELKIVYFRVVPVERNGEVWHEFHWRVQGARRVRLFEGRHEMKSRMQLDDGSFGWPDRMSGSSSIRLRESTKFDLVAEGRDGRRIVRSASATVASVQSPEIANFRASQKYAPGNRPIHLYWRTRNAGRITLYANGRRIASNVRLPSVETKGFSVTPRETTTYRLVAEGAGGRRVFDEVKVGIVTVRRTGYCKAIGRVTGKWRQQIRERRNGPATTWVVDMLLFKRGEQRARDSVRVRGGSYEFGRVPANGDFYIQPAWRGDPGRVWVTNCRDGGTAKVKTIKIVGQPLLD